MLIFSIVQMCLSKEGIKRRASGIKGNLTKLLLNNVPVVCNCNHV